MGAKIHRGILSRQKCGPVDWQEEQELYVQTIVRSKNNNYSDICLESWDHQIKLHSIIESEIQMGKSM